jgi:hypothetical protein
VKEVKVVAISNDHMGKLSEPSDRRFSWKLGLWPNLGSDPIHILPENISSNEHLLEQLEKFVNKKSSSDECRVCIKELTLTGHGAGGGIMWDRWNKNDPNQSAVDPLIFNHYQITRIDGFIKSLKEIMCPDGIIKLQGCATAGIIEHNRECQLLANALELNIGGETNPDQPIGPDRNNKDNIWFTPKK